MSIDAGTSNWSGATVLTACLLITAGGNRLLVGLLVHHTWAFSLVQVSV